MKRPPDQNRWGRRLRRWPEAEVRGQSMGLSLPPFEVWRSRDFLVQLFDENGHIRITVNRTHKPNGIDWADGISWDELQQIKTDIGRGDRWAVELYPAAGQVINDANMRHLWLLEARPPFAWDADDGSGSEALEPCFSSSERRLPESNRWKVPVASASREELVQRMCELRAQVLGYKRIATELGVSQTTVRRAIVPGYAEHLRQLSHAAKRRRTGTCERCGAPTRYNGKPGKPAISRYCFDCGAIVGGEIRREAQQGKGPRQLQALAFLTSPRRFSEIRDHLGTTDGHIAQLLHRLRQQGRIRRIERGVYVATSESRAREPEAVSPTEGMRPSVA